MIDQLEFTLTLYGMPTRQLPGLASHGEHCGFSSAFLGDHVLAPAEGSPYPYDPAHDPKNLEQHWLNECWVALGAIAASTSTLKIGTGVLVLPQRNVFVTALAAASVQNISDGRFLFGVGSGWLEAEFAALGYDFGKRGARMDEMIPQLRQLWSGDTIDGSATLEAVDPIPILIGGSSAPAIRRCGQLGDGWYGAPNMTLQDNIDFRTRVDQVRADAGRADLPFDYYVRVAPEPTYDNVMRFVEAGFRKIIIPTIDLWQGKIDDSQACLDVLSRVGDEVIAPAVAAHAES